MQIISQLPYFHVWQHFDSNWTTTHMQKLTDVPEVPVTQLYKHMIGQNKLFYHLRSTTIRRKDFLLQESS